MGQADIVHNFLITSSRVDELELTNIQIVTDEAFLIFPQVF